MFDKMFNAAYLLNEMEISTLLFILERIVQFSNFLTP